MNKRQRITLFCLLSTFAVFIYLAGQSDKRKNKPQFQAKLNIKKTSKPSRKPASTKPLILPQIAKPAKRSEAEPIVATENVSTDSIQEKMQRFLPQNAKVEMYQGESFTETINGVDVYKEVFTVQTTMPNGQKRAFNAIYNPSTERIEYTWGMEKSIGSFFKKLKAKRAAKAN